MNTLNLKSVDMRAIISELPTVGSKIVVFDDGSQVVMPVRKLIFHLIFWSIARKWGVPVLPSLIVETHPTTSSTIGNLGTKILVEIQKTHNDYHEVVFDFSEAMDTLSIYVTDNCQEYHRSLSILDLVDIADIPSVKAICENKVNDPNIPMKEAERQIKANVAKLYEELCKPHPANTIYDFINLRFVNPTQLAHIFYQIGFRTDIDDTVIRYPVQGNYLDGLQNIIEFGLEALSAKKSAFYNKDSLPDTEYFVRRQHILLSSVPYFYPGDCGSQITLPILVTKKLRNDILFKNFVDGSRLITMTKDNVDKYIGQVVQFRTPIGCNYTNGVCEACGGKLIAGLPPNTHIGIFSAIQVTAVITQVILSAKHMQDTRTVEYIIPEELAQIFIKVKGSIFIKPKFSAKLKKLSLVIPTSDTKHLMNLGSFNLSRLNVINESLFGTCGSLLLMKNNVPMTDQVDLGCNGQHPLYSKYLIKYIEDHPEHVSVHDEMFILDLSDYDFMKPLFKIIVMNSSMVKFVGKAKTFLESTIKEYTSATKAVTDFAELVYAQVHPNLTYLEIVLRGALATSAFDHRIPIVTDMDNVKFDTNKKALQGRSIGQLCAFQELHSAFYDASMFLVPKEITPFDSFLNLKEKDYSKKKKR